LDLDALPQERGRRNQIVDPDLYLLRGRVRFLDSRGGRQATPFSLMLLTLGATAAQKARYAGLVPGFWLARDSAAGVAAIDGLQGSDNPAR
jgi:hypothetical protein